MGSDTLSKARRIGYDGIMVAGQWGGAVLGAVVGVLVGVWSGWLPALVAAYFGWTSGGAVGSGLTGTAAFRGIDRAETGNAVGAIAFGVGAAAGAALGAALLSGVDIPTQSGLGVLPGFWLGAFGGFALAGALLGGAVGRIAGAGDWEVPIVMATLPTLLAAGGAGLTHLIGIRIPAVPAVIIGVVLIWGAGALGKMILSIDPVPSRYDDDRPCGY